MPRPVDASSFKSGGRQGSVGGSSDTSNTYSVRQVVVRRPAHAFARGRSSSSASPVEPKNQVRESAKVLAKFSSLAARKEVASDAKSRTSATSLEVPVGLASEQTSAEKRIPANNIHVNYTLGRSPLAQNPFNDPADEDWRTQSDAEESLKSPTLKTVKPDPTLGTKDDETPPRPQNEEAEQQGQELKDGEEDDDSKDERTARS